MKSPLEQEINLIENGDEVIYQDIHNYNKYIVKNKTKDTLLLIDEDNEEKEITIKNLQYGWRRSSLKDELISCYSSKQYLVYIYKTMSDIYFATIINSNNKKDKIIAKVDMNKIKNKTIDKSFASFYFNHLLKGIKK